MLSPKVTSYSVSGSSSFGVTHVTIPCFMNVGINRPMASDLVSNLEFRHAALRLLSGSLGHIELYLSEETHNLFDTAKRRCPQMRRHVWLRGRRLLPIGSARDVAAVQRLI